MARTRTMMAVFAAIALLMPATGWAGGDFPKESDPDFLSKLKTALGAIKPLPVLSIPDDPPPHEGATIGHPYVIEPPDLLDVEVLEALPGRQITGERLVRPDGTIGLGFYGEVEVNGLTLEQAKVKVTEHLRQFLSDEQLGLVELVASEPRPGADKDQPLVKPRAPGEGDAPPAAARPDGPPRGAGVPIPGNDGPGRLVPVPPEGGPGCPSK